MPKKRDNLCFFLRKPVLCLHTLIKLLVFYFWSLFYQLTVLFSSLRTEKYQSTIQKARGTLFKWKFSIKILEFFFQYNKAWITTSIYKNNLSRFWKIVMKHLRCSAALLWKEKVPLLGPLVMAIVKLSINWVHLVYKTRRHKKKKQKTNRYRLFTHRSCKEVEIDCLS